MRMATDNLLSSFRIDTKSFAEVLKEFRNINKLGQIYQASISFNDDSEVFHGSIIYKPKKTRGIKRKE